MKHEIPGQAKLGDPWTRGVGAGGLGGLQPPQYSDVLYSYHIHITISAPPILTTLIRPCPGHTLKTGQIPGLSRTVGNYGGGSNMLGWWGTNESTFTLIYVVQFTQNTLEAKYTSVAMFKLGEGGGGVGKSLGNQKDYSGP